MRFVKTLLVATTLLALSNVPAKAELNVVASIKPVHSLVAAVMEGVGTPGLIVEGAGSPHTYSLKPSQARMLQSADVVFWVGHELETFLEKPLEALASKAKTVELMDAHGLITLKFREGGNFEAHDHSEHEAHHDEHDHDEHAKADDHDHHEDHDDHKGHDHHDDHKDHDDHKRHGDHDDHKDHADEHDHSHDGIDPHVWLDPVNAKAFVHEIEEILAAADPAHAKQYAANAKKVMTKLDALTAEIAKELAPVKGKGFIVFHDAYHYFEEHFGLQASGAITVSPEIMPGAERINEIQNRIKKLGATCVFAEPQFEPKLVSTVIEGSDARSGVLDPLGASLQDGPDLYFELLHNMAHAFESCLGGAS